MAETSNYDRDRDTENTILRAQAMRVAAALTEHFSVPLLRGDTGEALSLDERLLLAGESWRSLHAALSEARDQAHIATRERDEARLLREAEFARFKEERESRNNWKARAEKAEADCAALVEGMNLVENDLSEENTERAHRRVIAALKKEHPGSALLDRLRAAEAVVEAAREPLATMTYAWPGRPCVARLAEAITTHDAVVKP